MVAQYPNEEVLCIPAQRISEIGFLQGFTRNYDPYLRLALDYDVVSYLPRATAEQTSHFKQVVSYVLVRDQDSLLLFRRGAGSSVATSIRDRLCIGFGGHINASDAIPLLRDTGYLSGVVRELSQELQLPTDCISEDDIPVVGVINDDSTLNGLSHIAFVHLWQPRRRDFFANERGIRRLRWEPINSILDQKSKYEYW